MKGILVDLYKTKDLYSGLGQFSMNFANELTSQLPEEMEVDFLIPRNNQVSLLWSNVGVIRTTFLKRHFPSLNNNYDIWHSLEQFPSFFPSKKTTWILTIHDLNFLIEKNEKKRLKYLKRLQKNIDSADYITTISNFTKEEIQKNFNLEKKEISVIYNGVPSGAEIEKIKPKFIESKKFLFSIGIFNEKKNFKSLLPLMKHFDNYQLVIAGNKDTSYGREIEMEIDKLGLKDSIILPGKINDSNRQWLYANCEAFLFPSLAEGFGLPVIEAMHLGKPVFLSRHTSLPEIGGSTAFYFDNFQAQHMSDLISSKLEYVQNNLETFEAESIKHASKFNWKNCMSEYLELYKKIKIAKQNKK